MFVITGLLQRWNVVVKVTTRWSQVHEIQVRLWGITMAKHVVCRYTYAMQMHTNSNYKNHDFSRGSLFM